MRRDTFWRREGVSLQPIYVALVFRASAKQRRFGMTLDPSPARLVDPFVTLVTEHRREEDDRGPLEPTSGLSHFLCRQGAHRG